MGCNCEDDKPKPFTEYSLVKAGSSVIKHFTNPEYDAFCTEEEKAIRLKRCSGCDMLRKKWRAKYCGVCKCFIDAKASLKDQTCPHPNGSKWT